MLKRMKLFLENPWKIFYNINKKKWSHIIPDIIMIKLLYRAKMGKKLNLKNPKTFNEKLQWLKVYYHNPEYSELVDKYEVRKYVEDKIGEEYIIPLLGVWNSVDEIDFDSLPNQFVLKCNHDSGSTVVCKDKSLFDFSAAKEKLSKKMNTNFYWLYREMPYKDVKKRILAEEYIEDIKIGEARDYKFFCFSGEVKCFKIDYGRFVRHHSNWYDRNGNFIPYTEIVYPSSTDVEIEIPKEIPQMIELAEKLAEDIPFVRIDFYCVNSKIYFGEMTFYHGSGFLAFNDVAWDTQMGSWLELPPKYK